MASSVNITKSPEDSRLYRGVTLDNGLRALLISDESTDKSAASLDLNVGSMSDPRDLQGLAHFCEHMLFMGTEKYTKENDFSKFIAEHSGISTRPKPQMASTAWRSAAERPRTSK